MGTNREKWSNDPAKIGPFKARENFVLLSLGKIEKVEEEYREKFGLSAVAMSRLVELYNLRD